MCASVLAAWKKFALAYIALRLLDLFGASLNPILNSYGTAARFSVCLAHAHTSTEGAPVGGAG